MLLFERLPTSDLIGLCRALRHNLDAGITLQQVFNQQAKRGSAAVRPVADRIALVLKKGYDLERALEDERRVFPPLFISLVCVGEQTGMLPEVFTALESYYTLQQRLWRQFVSQSTLPILQFFAAIFVVAGLIFVLGLIAEMNPGTVAMDPIGLGTGAVGATRFLVIVFGTIGVLGGLYLLSSRFLRQRAVIDLVLLNVPGVGPCLYALAMARFCLALRFTLETALAIAEALDLSLRASGNAAFAARSEQVQTSIRSGDDLTTALAGTRLFTDEFVSIVATGEESGRLPEVMKHQAKFYEEEAERQLAVLTKLSGFAVWAFVAALIVVAIFRIAMMYLNTINQFMPP